MIRAACSPATGCGQEVLGAELPARSRGARAHRRGGGARRPTTWSSRSAPGSARSRRRSPPPSRRRRASSRSSATPTCCACCDAELGGEPRVEIAPADAAAFDFAAASARRRGGRSSSSATCRIRSRARSSSVSSRRARGRDRARRRHGPARVRPAHRRAARAAASTGGSRWRSQQHAEARILFHVQPGSFHPAPAVISSVMRLVPRAAPLAPVRDAALFDEVVKHAFSTRRKMLRRALEPAFGEEAAARRAARPAGSTGPGAPRSFRSPTSRGSRTLSPPPGRPERIARGRTALLADLIAGGRDPLRVPRRPMPELPEVETIVRGLARAARPANHGRLEQRPGAAPRRAGRPPRAARGGVGRTVVRVRRRGKYILLETAEGDDRRASAFTWA